MAKVKSFDGLPVFKVEADEWYDLFNSNIVKDNNGKRYVSHGHFLAEEPEELADFIAKVHVIIDEDGQRFGFFYYDKGNDTVTEYNEEKFGLVGDYDADPYYGFYVYEPVREFAITGYQRLED